ncbi:sulfotransferase family protein [Nocardia asteroides]|uniref:sulfotransferase family protein n=1 Tax=Nocardia asteroides TaxID=1824 RepID=UPI001E2EBAFF|nr:sulfotransferase [Nocardia asteroides]UGT61492.1 sulfotransferase [Nocardia asteroides]
MTTMGRAEIGTIDDLHASATKVIGLEDFGADDYRAGLAVLLESYAADAELTPWGNKINRALLRGGLIARALSESAWQKYPEHAQVPVERPIFVTGLPRSGTTAVHRLLTADPMHQGLEMWLTEMPQPRPPRDTWASNPVYQGISAGYEKHHVEHPEFMGVHHISADQVEECWQLLRQSAMSISYECLAYLPTYSDWLRGQDWTSAYRRHRKNLQLIGLPNAEQRWVLKNPSHLFALDALFAVYPDALVVQLHREPSTIIASVCSLNEKASAGWSEKFRGDVVGSTQLELWARGADTFRADRAAYDQAQFIDVYYDDFVADPLAAVRGIYRHFGIDLTPAAEQKMTALHNASTSGAARPQHRYTLDDYGLTAGQVDERFAEYRAAHFPG